MVGTSALRDLVGLCTFASDVSTDTALVEKEGNEESILGTVRGISTRGLTMFYGAKTRQEHKRDEKGARGEQAAGGGGGLGTFSFA